MGVYDMLKELIFSVESSAFLGSFHASEVVMAGKMNRTWS
jgi:hypothetical protein